MSKWTSTHFLGYISMSTDFVFVNHCFWVYFCSDMEIGNLLFLEVCPEIKRQRHIPILSMWLLMWCLKSSFILTLFIGVQLFLIFLISRLRSALDLPINTIQMEMNSSLENPLDVSTAFYIYSTANGSDFEVIEALGDT